uniref:CUB domain-containing protein n=1 Tax=Steinernema glaseri TaxID=37863 RepID=A0A1I7Z1Q1_9BILA
MMSQLLPGANLVCVRLGFLCITFECVADGESLKPNVEILRGPGEINKSTKNPHVEVRHITSQVGLSVLERLSYIRHTSTFLSHPWASALIHILFQAPMLSRVVATAVFLILLPSSTTATRPFFECRWNDQGTRDVSVPLDGSVGLRSYGWPNTMTQYDGFCQFDIESTSYKKQNLALFFTNAHVMLAQDGGDTLTIDTDDQEHVQAMSTYKDEGELNVYVKRYSFMTWIGFEAVIGTYNDPSHGCPFTPQYNRLVYVFENEPQVAASQWDFSAKSGILQEAYCSWRFAPPPGYTLKVVFYVFSISEKGESVELSEDGDQLFSVGSGEELPSRVFYTQKGFKLFYKRMRKGVISDSSRFVAVFSSFPTPTSNSTGCICTNAYSETEVCSGDITLTTDLQFTNIKMDYSPYENNQECKLNVNTTPGKMLQLYLDYFDVENFADTLTLQTPSASIIFMDSSSDLTPVYTTNGSEVAKIHWKSDGNYGRLGFRIKANHLDCTCSSPRNIVLSETIRNAVISPAAHSKHYCPGMLCQWTISSPPSTLLVVKPSGSFRGSSCEKGTSASTVFDDYLEASDGTTSFTQRGSESFPMTFFNKSVSVNFRSSSKAIEFTCENGNYEISLFYVDLLKVTGRNTVIPVTRSSWSTFYNSYDFYDKFSSVTYTLGEELKEKKLQLYPLTLSWSTGVVAILDGDLRSHVAITTVGLLTSSGPSSGYMTPFTSTTGSITILCLESVNRTLDGYDFFIKVYDDSRDCDENKSVYYVDYDTPNSALFNASSTKLPYCPLTILRERDSSYNALLLFIHSIEGTDKNVKVFPGSDFSVTPFFEFNQDNLEEWFDNDLFGDLFTLLVPVGGKLNFTARFTDIPNSELVSAYSPTSGIFMSQNYPFGDDSGEVYDGRALRITSPSRPFKVDFEVVVAELSSSSSLQVVADSKTIMSLSGAKNLTKSYSTDYFSEVKFGYDGINGEKGFFVRYRTTSGNDSWVSPTEGGTTRLPVSVTPVIGSLSTTPSTPGTSDSPPATSTKSGSRGVSCIYGITALSVAIYNLMST